MHLAILVGTASERGPVGDHGFLMGTQELTEHNDVPIAEH